MREKVIFICNVWWEKRSHPYHNKKILRNNSHEKVINEVPTVQVKKKGSGGLPKGVGLIINLT